MAGRLQLMAGAEVRCTDGRVGHVRALIFDPQAGTVTHLSVDASSVMQNGRIVPLGDVQSAGPPIQLGCTRADYYELPENEDLDVLGGPSLSASRAMIHVHLVPHGETAIKADENVYATDGRAGHLIGAAVDRDSHTVQELLVRVGHLSRRHEVSIPFDAVASIDEHGVHIRLSMDEVSNSNPS